MNRLFRSPQLSDRERDMLRAAVLDQPSGAEAWSRLRVDFDVDALTPTEFELLPRLAANLERIDPDYPDLARLRGYRRHTWTSNQVALTALADVAAVLDGAGIETLAFGAAASAIAAYDKPSLRRILPPQLLVPPAAFTDARAALAGAGFLVGAIQPPGPTVLERFCTAQRGESSVLVARYPAPALGWPGAAGGLSAFWSDTVTAELAGRVQRLVGAEAAFVIASAEALAGHGPVRLAALADLYTIVNHANPDWDRVVAFAREQHATGIVADALTLTSSILGSPITPADLQLLTATPISTRDRLVHRLHELPAFSLPVLGGALDWIGRAIAATAPLPPRQALSAGVHMLAAHWAITSWRMAPMVLLRKTIGVRRSVPPGRA